MRLAILNDSHDLHKQDMMTHEIRIQSYSIPLIALQCLIDRNSIASNITLNLEYQNILELLMQ